VSSGAPDGSLDRLDSPLQVLISLLLQGSRDSVCTCQQSVFNVTTLPLRICSLIRLSLSLCLSVCPCVYFSAYVCFSNLDLRCRRRVARAVLSLSRIFVTAATAAVALRALCCRCLVSSLQLPLPPPPPPPPLLLLLMMMRSMPWSVGFPTPGNDADARNKRFCPRLCSVHIGVAGTCPVDFSLIFQVTSEPHKL